MLVPSPRCILNCQALSIHLPPLPDSRDHSSRGKFLSPPMSASPKHSRFVNSPPHPTYHRQYSLSPESTRSASSKPAVTQTREAQNLKSRPQHLQREVSTPTSSTDIEDPRRPSHLNNDAHLLREESNDEQSSATQDSPEAQHLAAGMPGIARRAKAHVPSACVNCKRKHLACETRRPCNRCVQTGKEVSQFREMNTFHQLIQFRQLALTFNTRNEADPGYERRTTRVRWISHASTLNQRFIRTEMVFSQFRKLAVVDRNHTGNYDLSRAIIMVISGHERPILIILFNSMCKELHECQSHLLHPIYPRAPLPYY